MSKWIDMFEFWFVALLAFLRIENKLLIFREFAQKGTIRIQKDVLVGPKGVVQANTTLEVSKALWNRGAVKNLSLEGAGANWGTIEHLNHTGSDEHVFENHSDLGVVVWRGLFKSAGGTVESLLASRIEAKNTLISVAVYVEKDAVFDNCCFENNVTVVYCSQEPICENATGTYSLERYDSSNDFHKNLRQNFQEGLLFDNERDSSSEDHIQVFEDEGFDDRTSADSKFADDVKRELQHLEKLQAAQVSAQAEEEQRLKAMQEAQKRLEALTREQEAQLQEQTPLDVEELIKHSRAQMNEYFKSLRDAEKIRKEQEAQRKKEIAQQQKEVEEAKKLVDNLHNKLKESERTLGAVSADHAVLQGSFNAAVAALNEKIKKLGE